MSKLQGEILTLPKMSGSVSTTKSLIGNIGAKTINIGEKGDDGATFIPSVSADGVISWTNDKELPNPEPVNIKGGKGDPGENGKDGADGQPGAEGKSAYKYAVVGGYTGTEADFAAKMAEEIPAVDATLTKSGQSADAKVTGDAIRSLSEEKVDKDQGVENAGKALVVGSDGNVVPGSVALSEDETISLLIEEDILPAVYNADGLILTDQNGNIVLRY